MDNKVDTSSSGAISCLLCGGHFIYPGPKYPNHLLACHGAVSDSSREYLVKASEYRKANGELPEIDSEEDSAWTSYDTMDTNNDYVVENMDLTSWMNPDPRIRKAFSTSTPYVTFDGSDVLREGSRRANVTARMSTGGNGPRIRKAEISIGTIWDNDDKTRDPDFKLGMKKSRTSNSSGQRRSGTDILQISKPWPSPRIRPFMTSMTFYGL